MAFVLLPEFTLSTLAGFVDALRIAADEADRSRQRHCRWAIIGPDRDQVRSSCGILITPGETFNNVGQFDYTVVIGGLVRGHENIDDRIVEYLRRIDAERGVLVGICTGSFVLARAGLMKAYRSCVHWAHVAEFVAEFPGHRVDGESVYLVDGRRVTCAGGQSAVDVAVHLIERHCGRSLARKVTSSMLIEAPRSPSEPQPYLEAGWFRDIKTSLVQRAILLMEQQSPAEPVTVSVVAARLGVSVKTLSRAFDKCLSLSPFVFQRLLRISHGRWDILHTTKSIATIAWEQSFSDVSHFTRVFREYYGITPAEARAKGPRHFPRPDEKNDGRSTGIKNRVLWSETPSRGSCDWPLEL